MNHASHYVRCMDGSERGNSEHAGKESGKGIRCWNCTQLYLSHFKRLRESAGCFPLPWGGITQPPGWNLGHLCFDACNVISCRGCFSRSGRAASQRQKSDLHFHSINNAMGLENCMSSGFLKVKISTLMQSCKEKTPLLTLCQKLCKICGAAPRQGKKIEYGVTVKHAYKHHG